MKLRILISLCVMAGTLRGVTAAVQTAELYAGASVPAFGIDNYSIGTDGVQFNVIGAQNSSLGAGTSGSYFPIYAFRKDTWTYDNKVYTSQTLINNSYFDGWQIIYFNLSKLPKGLKIVHAYLGLSGSNTGIEYGSYPNGQERIPIRLITNPLGYPSIWTCAYKTTNTAGQSVWKGASWLYREQTTTGTTLWSASKSCMQSGGTGPGRLGGSLYTVCQPIAGDPRISFNADGVTLSVSDELTTVVQQMVDGTLENDGFALDTTSNGSTIDFGVSSNPNPKFTVLVGVQSSYVANAAQRPRLIIEYNDGSLAGVTPTPTPMPDPVLTPTPTPTPDPALTPTPTPDPTPTPTPDPAMTPTPTPDPVLTPTPTPDPTATPTPPPEVTETPTPTPTPDPTQPAIKSIEEDGQSVLVKGGTYPITWQSDNIASSSAVWIRLFKGGSYYYTLSGGTLNDGLFYWTVPTSLSDGTDYTIRVTWLDDTSIYGVSDQNFSIVSPGEKAILPNAVRWGWTSYE